MTQRVKTPYGTLYQNVQRGSAWHLTGSVPRPSGGVYRFNRSCATTNLNDAKRKAKDVYQEAEVAASAAVSQTVTSPEQKELNPLIEQELAEFLHIFYEIPSKNGEKDESTWEDADKCLSKFFNSCPVMRIKELNEDQIAVTWNRVGKISPKYKAKVVYSVRKFIRWEITRGNLTADPTKDFKAPKRKQWGKGKDDEPWETVHFAEYLEACKVQKLPYVRPLDWEIAILLRATGISQADVYTLTDKDLPNDGQGLVLDKEREKSGIRYNQPITKRGDDLSALCEKMLIERMAVVPKGERLFKQGNTDQDRWVNDMTNRRRRVQLALGHPIRATKGLRTMFATEKIKAGVPEFILLKWMGHSENSTILRQHYLRLQSTRQWA